jgi:membrane-bound metal-dependent hydrolase YbcI (DUF457 family)
MPSPVGHTLAGLALADAFGLNDRRRLETVLWANAPDLDMIPGLIGDHPDATHADATHSLGATLLVATGAGVIARIRGRSAASAFGRAAAAYGSHLLLDYLGKESSEDGMQLFWPASKREVASRHEWFPTIVSENRRYGFWKGLLLWHNVKAVAREVGTLAPFWGATRAGRGAFTDAKAANY